MRNFLALTVLAMSATFADAAGLGLGAARVRVRAPGVAVNVGGHGVARGGLFGRGLFHRRNVASIRVFNRSAVVVGHSYNIRAVAVNAYPVYQQQVYAQPVIVQPQQVYVQQQVYAAPVLQSVYAQPVVQYVQPVVQYAVAQVNYCAPLAVQSYSSCGSGLRSFIRVR